jgi:DNA-binding LytR/AlgR family response regulator
MNPSKQQIDLFLRFSTRWGAALFITWFAINIFVLAISRVFEYEREGKSIPFWEPLSWEMSSQIVILILIPIGLYIHDHWIGKFDFKWKFCIHCIATIPFSALHIASMVGIRKIWYFLMDTQYRFGNLQTEALYEYHKDAQTYLTLALAIFCYRFIVRRLQGEASYLSKDEVSDSSDIETPPERLLIKKLGREFLIQTADIEWIEASGNYANLHIENSVYPMRITMDKLEKLLPTNFIRIHRSTIVNLDKIQDMQPLDTGDHQVTLHNQTVLTLSRRYREAFKSKVSFD